MMMMMMGKEAALECGLEGEDGRIRGILCFFVTTWHRVRPSTALHPCVLMAGMGKVLPPWGGWGHALSSPQQGGAKPACLCAAHTCWSGGARPAGRTLSVALVTDGSRPQDHPVHGARTGLPGQGRSTRAQKRVRTGLLKAHTRMEEETEAGREEPGSEAMGRGSASRTEAAGSTL